MPDLYTTALIIHLIGAVLGAGGASASAMIFFRSIDDLRLTKVELSFLHGASGMVWTGFGLLVVSGVFLAWATWETTSISPKFWAKMTIVGIIFLNGLFLNLRLLPRFVRHADTDLRLSEEFVRLRHEVFISGAVSGTSWYAALILGASRGLTLGYFQIIGLYLTALIVAIGIGLLVGHQIFEKKGE
jgi:hypothetical protein